MRGKAKFSFETKLDVVELEQVLEKAREDLNFCRRTVVFLYIYDKIMIDRGGDYV